MKCQIGKKSLFINGQIFWKLLFFSKKHLLLRREFQKLVVPRCEQSSVIKDEEKKKKDVFLGKTIKK